MSETFMKYTFRNDYSEGCHPNILKALTQTNMVQSEPYGNDAYSIGARELIRAKMGTQDTAIFFVSGGTLVNLILHSVALRSHEAVIAPQSGHILTNEAGAVEATGHKIVSADVVDGKLTAQNLQKAIDAHQHYPHITLPRLVYISNATEVGTVYSKAEIVALSAICRANNLYFMVDGARMGAAISSDASDLTLADLAEYVDIFWIGGTKAGALFGEAIVIPNKDLAKDFEVHLKQRGALLAKGRALGIQFQELFTDNLFFKLAKRGNDLALKIADNILAAGFEMAAPCEANMLMPILPNTLIDSLEEQFDFYRWKKIDDDHTQLRLVTSWATDEAQVDRFIGILK
jgi:threonine aldolase